MKKPLLFALLAFIANFLVFDCYFFPERDNINDPGSGSFIEQCVFVAVGGSGRIMASPDAEIWLDHTISSETDSFQGVTFGMDIFLAVGETGIIYTSPDSASWDKQDPGVTFWINSAAYGNNTFVAVGEQSKIIISSDGESWTDESEIDGELSDIVYADNIFVAVGSGGRILTSTDGREWTDRTPAGATAYLYSVTWGKGRFVAVGENGTVYTSPDAGAWDEHSVGTADEIHGVAFGKNRFVAVGTEKIMTSSDGISWDIQTYTGDYLHDITFGNDIFVAVGEISGENGMIRTSVDGLTWAEVTTIPDDEPFFYSVECGDIY